MPTSSWFKSTHSRPDEACVEGSHTLHDAISIRDSKAPAQGTFLFRKATWTPFLATLKTTNPPPHA
ncbi:DUF397 domain-containing protein [Embleya sp. NPDC005971]|uniref:DUF397 domain-containing protein n=1 Tax=unclassified Embleya TaxID=2699296 RepID=UPI00340A41A0